MNARGRLLDALRDNACTLTSSGTSSTCPAHEDRAPSLSIGQRADGDGVVLHCHAGCDVEDVLAALKLTAADLFDRPRQAGDQPVAVAAYPYVDEAGRLLYQKVRLEPKSFRQRRPDGHGGWTWNVNGTRRVLYRLPELVAAVAAGETVHVVEGEKDADALSRAGVTATTWTEGAWRPGQAPKWREDYTSQLAGAHVTTVRDRDDAGRHSAAVIAGLLAGTAGSVRVVEPAEGKDAADHLDAGRAVEQLVPVDVVAERLADEPTNGQVSTDTVAGGPPATDSGKVPAAARLVELAHDGYTFAATPAGEPYAVPTSGPRIPRLLRGGTDSLRAALAEVFFDATGRVPPQQALTDALLVLEGRARHGTPRDLAMRVATADGHQWLDLGDQTGRAVRIGPDGWRVVEEAPVLFRRTALTGHLPTPQPGGTLDELWQLLNVTGPDRPLVVAVLVAELLPDIPHPVVKVDGEQGSGKSTATRVLAGLLDPSAAQLRKPPRDVEAWITAASGSWVVAVDNVSTLPDWFSDSLCRASTGDGDARRRLYSDGDLYVVAFRRCVIINGIDLGAVRDDLADRLVTITLGRIGDRSRRYDADLADQWAAAHPRILGALLDLAAQVLVALPSVVLADPPRMADFARVLAAVDVQLGTNGLDRYRSLAGDLAADAVTGDPVLAALADRITGPFTGTAAELLAAVIPDDERWRPGRDWPKNPRALTGVLRRRAPTLRRLGWTVEDAGRDAHTKSLLFHLAPRGADDVAGVAADVSAPTPATPAATPATRTPPSPAVTSGYADRAEVAGVAGVRYDLPLLSRSSKERREDAVTPALGDDPQSTPATSATSAGHSTQCPHGVQDGEQPDPFVNGHARCPQCRAQQLAAS